MARGFESKAVQDQQDSRAEQRDMRSRRERSPEEVDRDQQRESLLLSRRRIEHELASTTSELRRRSLEAALAHLDGELARFR